MLTFPVSTLAMGIGVPPVIVVAVLTAMVVETEATVRSLAYPIRYPAPDPARIATTNRAAIALFLMPQRVS